MHDARKRFKATNVVSLPRALRDTELRVHIPPTNTRVEFPWESGTAHRSFDFGAHYGCQIDLIVAWCQQVIEWHVQSRVHRIATISACCQSGLRNFFRFCTEVATERGAPLTLTDLSRELIERFIHWLALRGDLSYRTQQTVYRNMKFALGSLCSRGLLPPRRELFPFNPYPHAARRPGGYHPLSEGEREHVVRALQQDVLSVVKDTSDVIESDRLAVLLLAICLRTGLNLTPLVDLTRSAIEPHPIKERWGVLRTIKHRAHSAKAVSASPDVVFLYQHALRLIASYVEAARDAWKDRVWLYRKIGPSRVARGPIRLLGVGSLLPCIDRFVTRHHLRSDDSSRLRLSVSRLRKTLENRLWRLSGGDPFAVASVMGHGVRVADKHYFIPTPEMERNHKFLGEALVASWSGQEKLVAASSNSTNTPVGRCRDPYRGHLAPRDGKPCMDFLSCFRCPSYVLVEEEDDLWRLYSFYWFLIRERAQLGAAGGHPSTDGSCA